MNTYEHKTHIQYKHIPKKINNYYKKKKGPSADIIFQRKKLLGFLKKK